ncbi:MAG: RNA polymerase sigma factor [Hyphomicrobiales bacterium]|nr:RNA polymerase sigma factor [Hyphomicrobiales bacterium]
MVHKDCMESKHSEKAIARRLAAADRAAFEAIFHKHNAGLIGIAASIVGNRATAEEIAQETWLSVLTHAAFFEGRSSLAGWIFSILVNKAKTQAKRNGRMVSFDDDGVDNNLAAAFDGNGRWRDLPALWDEVTPERIAEGRSQLHMVNVAIDRLPAGQKSVLILRAQEGLDIADIAEILGISENNVRLLLHRARLAIRAMLGSPHN